MNENPTFNINSTMTCRILSKCSKLRCPQYFLTYLEDIPIPSGALHLPISPVNPCKWLQTPIESNPLYADFGTNTTARCKFSCRSNKFEIWHARCDRECGENSYEAVSNLDTLPLQLLPRSLVWYGLQQGLPTLQDRIWRHRRPRPMTTTL